jgi:DNA-binding transcriptional LysR family regulator
MGIAVASVASSARVRDDWLSIKTRHLNALVAVAREESFVGAADRLGYVQSAVSQQIAFLESVVGARLVDRAARARGTSLTPSGAVMLDHTERILRMLAEAKAELDVLARAPLAELTLGAWGPAADQVVGRLLALATHDTGRPGFTFERTSSSALLRKLEAGALDAAFVQLPIRNGAFSAVELVREPYLLAVPGDAAATDAHVLLDRYPLVGVDDCPGTAVLRARMTAGGGVDHVVETPAAALAFVRAGVGIAALTANDAPSDNGGVRLLRYRPLPERVTGLAWRRDRDNDPLVVELTQRCRLAWTRDDVAGESGGARPRTREAARRASATARSE